MTLWCILNGLNAGRKGCLSLKPFGVGVEGVQAAGDAMWRREWDSNPRYLAVNTLSKRAPSATRPSLQRCEGQPSDFTIGRRLLQIRAPHNSSRGTPHPKDWQKFLRERTHEIEVDAGPDGRRSMSRAGWSRRSGFGSSGGQGWTRAPALPPSLLSPPLLPSPPLDSGCWPVSDKSPGVIAPGLLLLKPLGQGYCSVCAEPRNCCCAEAFNVSPPRTRRWKKSAARK
jgi:hypothetical protein